MKYQFKTEEAAVILQLVTERFKNLKEGKRYQLELKDLTTRSVSINNRFNGWITHIWKTMKERGDERPREYYYHMALIEACGISEDLLIGGAKPYPWTYGDGHPESPMIIPYPTSGRSNAEMMAACQGVEELANQLEIVLPEDI